VVTDATECFAVRVLRLDQADRKTLLVGWRAMAGLLRARTAREATEVLVEAVLALGATVEPAATTDPNALPWDLSLGVGQALLPVAPVGERPRRRMELVLPMLIEEARVVVARAWHETLLGEQAEQDLLTGLLNQRGTSRLLPRLTGRDVVAVIDLDKFKQLNDSKGHAAGDELLAAFGQLLREHGRAQDRFGRLGGDEFVAIFPSTSLAQAQQVIERLSSAWEQQAPYPVTFSAGLVAAENAAGALGLADRAMYSAKAAGGGQARAALPTLPLPRAAARAADAAPGHLVDTVLGRLERGESRAAAEVAYSLLDNGARLRDLVHHLLAPVQDEVGKRWQQDRYTVADEHVATGAVQAALAAARMRVDLVARGLGHTEAGTDPSRQVGVMCPAGEWHELPSRMFSAMLSEAGFEVTVFGPSLPLADLARTLAARPFTAVVLSCTTAKALPAAGEAIRALHAQGIPVLAGGRAWGTSASRAESLGADGWAGDIDEAAAVLRAWALEPPPLRESPPPRTPLEQLVDSAVGQIVTQVATGPAAVSDLTSGSAAVRSVLGHLDAALAVDDPGLFQDYVDWLTATVAARGGDDKAVAALLAAVDRALGDTATTAHALLRAAAGSQVSDR
jgi:diguanylate cyclase (GGDEF)-like protein